MKKLLISMLVAVCALNASAEELTIKINKKYLNLPVSHSLDRGIMTISSKNMEDRTFRIRLGDKDPDYWVFSDMTPYKGKTITISYDGPADGLKKIYQSDQRADDAYVYKEANRPQVHFTQKVGWNNDPNGLLFYDGEYHLFYQHNPYEREWENMHWGHAVSRDLLHWEELPVALYPDEHGTMFSGSAVIDYDNTSGFGTKTNPAMVAIYTAAGKNQTQCVAYSLDKGRTWAKYDGNPVIDSKEIWDSNDTRDPKVFWYAPGKHWVMVLNERDGHSIYTSSNLKEWTYQSHTTGFWECPELFELPVDGDKNNTKWVMYGASATYMLGQFDGKKFTPETGKHQFITGSNYAAQTFTNMPESDGRRVQIGWGRISHPGMPFNGMMLFPVELSLHNTRDGIRLYSKPVREIESLEVNTVSKNNISVADAQALLNSYPANKPLLIKITFTPHEATSSGLNLNGQRIIDYDMNSNTVNGTFFTPERIDSKSLTAEILVDRTSIEVWLDGGRLSYSMEKRASRDNSEMYRLWGNKLKIDSLEISELTPTLPQ